VTTAPDPLATRRDELLALRELVAAAIAARRYVAIVAEGRGGRIPTPRWSGALPVLDRLDAAIADAGELLDGVTS
jgi:hypothetical protein